MYRHRRANWTTADTSRRTPTRVEEARARRYSASSATTASRRLVTCGPVRTQPSWRNYDRRFWGRLNQEAAQQDEKEEKEREEEEEQLRMQAEEAKKLDALTVEGLALHVRANAHRHRTNKYDCTTRAEALPVLRRGQEFNLTLTFSRAYNNKQDDLFFIVVADEENPAKHLRQKFQLDEEGSGKYKKDQEWGAKVLHADKAKKTLKVEIFIPADCVIGQWDLKIKTALRGEDTDYVYRSEKPLIILFNPWCPADRVHFTEEEKLLDEYILNDSGTVFSGSKNYIGSKPWSYGQFEKGILPICLSVLRKAFGFKMTPNMADPVDVSRALSKIINSADDQGVLVGNWSGDYEGGESPTTWKSSTDILRQYEKTEEPVKFGQCWVFSHLFTAVSRALGLPCRSVTNFASAHDTDNTCTIDRYFNADGVRNKGMSSDSIWNFHVWNEVWILRPDLPGPDHKYDGWHVVDATPQEMSHGVYQCGPCPVKAVQLGEINVGFDTLFVFGEVNADIIHWVVGADGDLTFSSKEKDQVGDSISTKCPDGKPHKRNIGYYGCDKACVHLPGCDGECGDTCDLRLDLTDTYKFPEGDPRERKAVERAIRFSKHGRVLYKDPDLEVTYDTKTETMMGQDLVLTAYVRNTTKEDKEAVVTMTARTSRYWNRSHNAENMGTQKFPLTIKAGQKEEFQLTVDADTYMKQCDESLCVYVFTCAKDVKANMPFCSQRPFRLRTPDLAVKGPESAKSGEAVTVTVSMTNPLKRPLTDVRLQLSGGLRVHEDDNNSFDSFFWTYNTDLDDIDDEKTLTLTLKLMGEVEDDEDGRVKTMDLSLQCNEIGACVTGCYNLLIHATNPAPPPADEEAE